MMACGKEHQLPNDCLMDHNNDLEKKSTLTERKRLLDEKLAYLECQSATMEREKKDFRTLLQDSRDTQQNFYLNEDLSQLNSRTVTGETADADLTVKNCNQTKATLTEVNDRKMRLFKIWSVNVETDNEKLRKQVQVLEENNASFTQQNELLSEKLVHYESWSVKMETHLSTHIKFLQENEDILIKQNEFLKMKVTELERWGEMTEKQNENLQARLRVLKENENIMNEMIETLRANLTHAETQRDKDQADMYCMRTKLRTVRCQLQDQDELLSRVDHAESRLEKACAENESLGNKVRELQEENNFLKKEKDITREEHSSLCDRQSEQIAQLKAAVNDNRHQLDKVQFVICSKDELLAKQKGEIDELNSLATSLKQTIHDLQSRVELRRMENILAETARKEQVSENQVDLRAGRKGTRAPLKALHRNNDPNIEQKRLFKHTLTLCDCPNLNMESENEELRAQLKELQEKQVKMAEMNSHLKEKLAHLEFWRAEMETKNDEFKTKLEYRNDTETVISDSCQSEPHMDTENVKSPQSRTDSESALFHLQDQGDLKKTRDHVEIIAEAQVAENEKLSNSQCEANILKTNEVASVKLGAHKPVGDLLTKNITQLKTGFKDHKLQIEESGIVLLCFKDDLFTMKTKDINQRDKRGDAALFITLGQSILNFQHKLERMEEILTADNI
ncbi:putative leucine-rich repeat-containing protein DDB_G0290503 [Hippocampus comes]|uniref:putative leucine-rich repeat-containing protein DDB_G0290503 n=1 Tax=Hippocampus comes TaxID=109280 RepID=UPI00094F39E5|nr:PREDICTED: putative leucine-rich repeat-containing protein DDB_G0290503 [Hippocampus comes]